MQVTQEKPFEENLGNISVYEDEKSYPLLIEKEDIEIEVTEFQTCLHDKDCNSGTVGVVSDSGSSSELPDRDNWSKSLDCILSLLGYSVGLGNLWRFPYLCMKNGGGAFLIPFVICLITLGIPMLFLEVALGQFIGKSCLHAWSVCPIFKGLGLGMVLVTIIIALYFNIILAWALYYFANSFTTTLPWSTCDGWWNTDACYIQSGIANAVNKSVVTNNYSLLHNTENTTLNISFVANISLRMSSEEEFWQYNALRVSTGFGDLGSIPWHLVVSLTCAWLIVFLCIIKGVRSVGKVVYVTALLPYVLLSILLVRGLTLEGSLNGIVYYLKPDVKKMMKLHVWVEAALQVFFSLGPGWGPIITMASYNKFKNNCYRDSLVVCLVGEGTSIFSGFVVFTILGFISHELQLPIDEVVKSGPGLGFIAYPQALARLPVPQLWSALFFVMLVAIGLDSQFANVESTVTCIIDLFPRLRKRQMLISLLACVAGLVLGLPMCSQGGIYIFQLVDWYVGIVAIPLFCFTECMIFGWIYGAERFCRDIRLMLDRSVPILMRICWCFVTPILIVCCFVFSLMTYAPPTYGDYKYPAVGQVIGWTIACVPLIPFVVVAVKQIVVNITIRSPAKALSRMIRPAPEWQPHSLEHQKSYSNNVFSYDNMSFLRRVKVNAIGDL